MGNSARNSAIVVGAVLVSLAACTHVSTARLHGDAVHVGKGMRPIAAIQANATRFNLLFIPLGGDVDLDKAINRLMIVKAKTMGADKVVILNFDATPSGIWSLRRAMWFTSSKATGIAVQMTTLPEDPGSEHGPEAPPDSHSPTEGAPNTRETPPGASGSTAPGNLGTPRSRSEDLRRE